ncbi:hypothetical protein GCM10023080_017570 [Streptomyces pseudoechinosporeus]
MKTIKDQVAVEATTAEQTWTVTHGAAMGEVAGRFPRREPRLPAREMAEGDPRPGWASYPWATGRLPASDAA